MSAPSLPNLLQSRGARGAGRGLRRGRGRGGGPSSGPGGQDEIVQGTDTDAAVSRLSAVDLGYLDDPYAKYFVQSAHGPASRRLPIINRGTYTRTTAVDTLVGTFLAGDSSHGVSRQIISLGAGTDTRPLKLFAKANCKGLVYHEIDFPAACTKKLRIVQGVPGLRSIFPNASEAEDGSWSAQPPSGGEYWCHGLDLRNLIRGEEGGKSSLPGLRTDVPTLLVSECCLCYLESSEAKQIIRWFTDKIANIAIVIYEAVKPDDAFGKMMVSNLAARRIRMPTLEIYKEPRDQVKRLADAGFSTVKVLTVHDIFELWVSREEKSRLDRLEGLDEMEEWVLLANHYIVAWGWTGVGYRMVDESGVPTTA
ncbi:hypothetical protein jhhlp_003679 [Lomentospora prolificans]|uniref:Leucine carboxyl methyltransferase 1 n=1 Tax=Lomentospora prolificans TaxID=41688 RepID=A0A2N3N9E7_9PEZI|nr:hypothetical protein jhhlp_003679 [Lomentospora prolificans]